MNLVPIGYFSRTHGTKGQLILKLEQNISSDELKTVFIEKGGSKAPFFIQDIAVSHADLILTLEEVSTIEMAKTLLNKTVLADEQLVSPEGNEDWLVYEVIDKHYGSLGKVLEVSDNGQQVLWHLKFRDKEVILPMVEDFIEGIEEDEKKVRYNAPEGLIDVYLES